MNETALIMIELEAWKKMYELERMWITNVTIFIMVMFAIMIIANGYFYYKIKKDSENKKWVSLER